MLVVMLVVVALAVADQQTMFLCSKPDCGGCTAEMLAFFVFRPDGSFADHGLSGQLNARPFTDITFSQQSAVLSVVAMNGATEAGRIGCGFGLCCATPTLQVSAQLVPISAILFTGVAFQGNETTNETSTAPPTTTVEPGNTTTSVSPANTTVPPENSTSTAGPTTEPASNTTTPAAPGNTTTMTNATTLTTTTQTTTSEGTTATNATTTTPSQATTAASGLTSGQVAGIVIGVLLGVTGIVVVLVIVLRRRRKSYARL